MPLDMSAVTKKIGPLQIWQYGAIVAALAWAYYWWTHRNETTNDAGSGYDFAAPDAGDSGLDFTDNTGVSANTGGSSTGAQSGSTTPRDNLAWLQAASTYLAGFNYEGVAINNALTKYLQGEALTPSERALVNQAIARFGVPPEGTPVSPGGTPTPPSLPPPDDRPGTPVPTPLPRGVPSIPGHLQVTSVGPTSAAMTWQVPKTGETSYYQVKGGPVILRTQNTSINVTGLRQKAHYSFYVRAFNSAGLASPWVGPASVTTR